METKKPTIAVAMIVKNEEAMLARCLDSVKGADAIYISDTGSEDNTVSIARSYTENVYTEDKWHDSFCDARNFVREKVKEDYILSIDADEYLKCDFSVVRETVEKAYAGGHLTVNCRLISEQEGQLHYYPRLFKKDDKVWWEGVAHNHISVKPKMESDIEIVYGYSPAHQKDPERTLRILTKEVAKTGNARETFYLGREHWYRNHYKECADLMGEYVKKAHFMAEKADAYLIMARCHWAMGMGNEARQDCLYAIAINPHFKEAVLFMATLAGKGSGNPTWEKNAEQWERMAKTADNSQVLFIRDTNK